MIFFPFVITLASLSPLNHSGAAAFIVRKMGLSGEAAASDINIVWRLGLALPHPRR